MRSLTAATLFAALAGFGILIAASRTLSVADYERFFAAWGAFFAGTGIIDGLTHETTRSVNASRRASAPGQARPWKLAIGVGVVGALLALVLGGPAGALLALGIASYSFQAVAAGSLAGTGRWRRYAGLIAFDSGIRVVLAGLAWWLNWGLTSFWIITVIGALSWILIYRHIDIVVDADQRTFNRRSAAAMAAAGSSAAMIPGFPFVLHLTTHGADSLTGVTIGAIMTAVTFTRAPIVVPLQRFQSALIVRFAHTTHVRALAIPVGIVLGVGLIGAILAGAIGPRLMLAITGNPALVAPGVVLALLTFASAFTGVLLITGAASLARAQHRRYVLGWLSATLASALVLCLPLPLEVAVISALIAGPVIGGTIHAWR
ncbi:hypothetical protein [Corynebacterium tapiri]|uniref:Uncharacterized protein n=1 Tax=Corynebacterium tapiri TaxID=1448266 RepID=A0A5C4U4F5_9CORY|nr:hypothetical protein [Corynebacterium tapiri]TNL97332.1 hypothetical protein FHE74_06570 [Corynebacterium tapiri]